jgi:hypothetical protein
MLYLPKAKIEPCGVLCAPSSFHLFPQRARAAKTIIKQSTIGPQCWQGFWWRQLLSKAQKSVFCFNWGYNSHAFLMMPTHYAIQGPRLQLHTHVRSSGEANGWRKIPAFFCRELQPGESIPHPTNTVANLITTLQSKT